MLLSIMYFCQIQREYIGEIYYFLVKSVILSFSRKLAQGHATHLLTEDSLWRGWDGTSSIGSAEISVLVALMN